MIKASRVFTSSSSSLSKQETQMMSNTMGIYQPFPQIIPWPNSSQEDINDNNNSPNTSSSIIQVEPSGNDRDHESRSNDKIRRRLAQNREAARKSRIRKKAYVRQLEESRLKLSQMEQELELAKQQGLHVRNSSDTRFLEPSRTMNTGIVAFEMEYMHWLEEEKRRVNEIRTALEGHISDIELRMLVDSCLNHYTNLFSIKQNATKADVSYIISGIWRTSFERFFQWIGGFRPSNLLTIVMPYIEPLTDQQVMRVRNLQESSQQAEDALSQGIDKLQQTLAECIVLDPFDSSHYAAHMALALDHLQALEGFVNQADHLRQQTLQQMVKILTTRQAARCLLALGDYFHRLRALSSLWSARPREPT